MKAKDQVKSMLPFLIPNFLGFIALTAFPILASFAISFTSWDLLMPPDFVGVDNFVELLGFRHTSIGWRANDPLFWRYLGNTLFMMCGIPFSMMGSLFLAILLNKGLRFSNFYRFAFYLPSMVSGVAIFYLWRWMYNPDLGLINQMLSKIGIVGPHWLSDIHWSKPALMLVNFWAHVGGTSMILYLAALQNISRDLYEAADIDGASSFQQFCAVTWPSVAPITFFILTMGIIQGFQSGFEMAYIMTNGGPAGSTTTMGYYIMTKAYDSFEMGYASAIAWVVFVLVLVVTLFQWKKTGKTLDV